MPRFVLLLHETPVGSSRPTHLDFMLEDAGKLLTWSVPRWPDEGGSVAAEALADHRLAYLDYEGEIRGGRGRVARRDRGRFRWLARDEGRLLVRLFGGQIAGEAELVRDDGTGPPAAVLDIGGPPYGWRLTFRG